MNASKKFLRSLMIAILWIISIYIHFYTKQAYYVADFIHFDQNEGYYWSYATSSFFPWPKEPRYTEKHSEISKIDLFFYLYFIKTNLLIIIAVLLWITTVYTSLSHLKFIKRLKPLKFSKRLLIVVFWVISTFITAYTIKAYLVSINICYFDGEYYWSSTGPGSFFPWPRGPGMLAALSRMSAIDKFFYLYFIKTMLLILIAGLTWIAIYKYTWNCFKKAESETNLKIIIVMALIIATVVAMI